MIIMNHWYSDEWCKDNHARTQEQLQNIAKQIRSNCQMYECKPVSSSNDDIIVCTIYYNENLGLKYWVKDRLGRITEIDEARYFGIEKDKYLG